MDLINYAKRIKALSEAGLVYAENEYDKERYEELKEISLELLANATNTPLVVLKDFYLPEKDYPTPKVDVRGFVLNESDEVLMVKESLDGKWSIPGGWGDIGFSPSEVIVKEIAEETGLTAEVVRLLAVFDKKCHPHPPQAFYVYKIVFHCRVLGGSIKKAFDIENVQWFAMDQLPKISTDRILKSQIETLYELVVEGGERVVFD